MKWFLFIVLTQNPAWQPGYATRADCEVAKVAMETQIRESVGKLACVPGPDVIHAEPGAGLPHDH